MNTNPQHIKTIQTLLEYSLEQEWFEFKANWFEPNVLGEYISALANAAAYHGRGFGYLICGMRGEETIA